jgi:predicted histidine transporter YuiF (NhaC family)
MAMLVAVVVVAALWQPIKLGAALLAGATVPLLAQAVSAVVQIQSPASPLQFGISPSEAQQAGLTITSGLTPAFWVYCAFVLALGLIAARMLTSPAAEPSAPANASLVTAGAGGGAGPEPGRTP